MFKWIKKKIFKDELERLANIEKSIANFNAYISLLEEKLNASVDKITLANKLIKDSLDETTRLNRKSDLLISEANELRNTITKIISIGVDINHPPEKSWAVICIGGNTDYMAFKDLHQSDIRTISGFLRQFERSNMRIDSPYKPAIMSMLD